MLSDSTPGPGKSGITDLPNAKFENRVEPPCLQIALVLAEVISNDEVIYRHFYPFLHL